VTLRTLTIASLTLILFSSAAIGDPPKRILLLGQGPDGHPPQTHEYMAGVQLLAKCLRSIPGLEVRVVRADNPWKDGPQLLAGADGVVLYLSEGARWIAQDRERAEAFSRLAARGGGLVALHWAIGTRDAKPIEPFLKLLGGCHGGPDRKYKVLETELQPAEHPIVHGITPFRARDEFYYQLKFTKAQTDLRPVLQARIDGRLETVAWAWERPDGGRSFGFSGLHFHDNWRLPEYRRLVVQAVLWSLKRPIPAKGVAVPSSESN
jgi:type 1 glutamine amidotransferase